MQNLEIVLPPIDDTNKLAIIEANLNYMSYNSPEPIIFRLYNQTTGKELTRVSIVQNNEGKVTTPVSLSYYGNLISDDVMNKCIDTESSCSEGSSM